MKRTFLPGLLTSILPHIYAKLFFLFCQLLLGFLRFAHSCCYFHYLRHSHKHTHSHNWETCTCIFVWLIRMIHPPTPAKAQFALVLGYFFSSSIKMVHHAFPPNLLNLRIFALFLFTQSIKCALKAFLTLVSKCIPNFLCCSCI